MTPLTPTGNPKDFKLKTSLHSVSYAGFWRGQAYLPVPELLEKAKELGFDGVTLMAKRPHVSPLDYGEKERAQLRRHIEKLGLTLVSLAGYTDFLAGSDRSGIPHVEIQAAYVGELARLARDLGTNIIRIFTGYERENIRYEQQYTTVLEGLKQAGAQAAEYGVTLAVQNHHDVALHHEVMRWLLAEVNLSNVKAAWDAWAPIMTGLTGEELRQSVLKMQPYLVHTSVADYVRMPRFHYRLDLTTYEPRTPYMRAVPLGEGFLDYKTFFSALKEIGYQGFINYEMCEILRGGGSIENLDKTARVFLQYVEKFR